MDIKSFFNKFRKKPDDDMIEADPFEVSNESPSRFSSILSLFRKRRTEDIEQKHIESKVPIENADNSSRSHLITNIALFCVLAVIIGIGAYVVRNNDKDKPASTFQSAKGKTNTKKSEPANNPSEVKVAYGNVMINPFVDLGEMKNKAKQEEAKTRKATIPPPIRSESSEESSFIPAIPSFNPPSQPVNAANKVRKIGEIPAPLGSRPSEAAQVPSGPVEVQGVLMGNDGSSMAILSDGSVVETGDTYKDGRIAYIGGDGIKFDDGSSMQFKD